MIILPMKGGTTGSCVHQIIFTRRPKNVGGNIESFPFYNDHGATQINVCVGILCSIH